MYIYSYLSGGDEPAPFGNESISRRLRCACGAPPRAACHRPVLARCRALCAPPAWLLLMVLPLPLPALAVALEMRA